MDVMVNIPIQTSIPNPSTYPARFGARIEVPVTRAIASYWRDGVLDVNGTWTVILDYIVAPGDYLLVWMDAAGNNEVFIPITAVEEVIIPNGGTPTPPPDDWPPIDMEQVLPSVTDVARLERTRTIAAGSKEEITFTEDTRPSAAEVTALILQAAPLVIAETPPRMSQVHWPAIRTLIALYTAMLIEASFYREEVKETSPGLWQKLYDQALEQLVSKVQIEYTQWNAAGGRIEIPGPCPPGYVPGQIQVVQPPGAGSPDPFDLSFSGAF